MITANQFMQMIGLLFITGSGLVVPAWRYYRKGQRRAG